MTDRLKGLRLLVAEDDFMVAIELGRILAGLGIEVVGPVPDVPRALDAARRGPIDGAILDIGLRGGGAYPAIDLLTERGVPVILATGYPVEALHASARPLPRLAKPYNARKLARLLLKIFEKQVATEGRAGGAGEPMRDAAAG